MKYRTDSLYEDLGGSILISDDGFQGTFTASLTPNCKASNSTHIFIYGFVFERLGYLGSGLDTVMTTNTKDIVTFTKQDLNITVTDDYVYPEKDTIEWEIRVSNLNTKALAKNVWLGALSNSNRKIVAIKDNRYNYRYIYIDIDIDIDIDISIDIDIDIEIEIDIDIDID